MREARRSRGFSRQNSKGVDGRVVGSVKNVRGANFERDHSVRRSHSPVRPLVNSSVTVKSPEKIPRLLSDKSAQVAVGRKAVIVDNNKFKNAVAGCSLENRDGVDLDVHEIDSAFKILQRLLAVPLKTWIRRFSSQKTIETSLKEVWW
ncbi:1-aminocyclopropane-1-carboxylate oxidase-like protein [Corchorus olitorius]|uniref:1-aminocyclopropane-1-carboxylate oxidase-like protein n=1 Tax=Corchorus olitorius TaxID=93759 RepID=A0A1R3GEC6_9ROSI|nr:1-aminocyclopropane-1-carboxylate oxidase-like protein [Corchorus olitorius]